MPNSGSPIIILGLGNPGIEFERTRHNVGYHVVNLVLDEKNGRLRRGFLRRYSYCVLTVKHHSLVLARSNSYMNRSGDVVPELLRRYGVMPDRFIVVLDNMDLAPGICRIKKGGGDAGHNGLKSVIGTLRHGDFYRFYIGVGRPPSGASQVDYVLSVPDMNELADINSACMRASQGILKLPYKPIAGVIEEINSRGT